MTIPVTFIAENSKGASFKKLLLMEERSAREEAGALTYKEAIKAKESTLFLDLKGHGVESLDFISGIQLASYRFDKYKTKKETRLESIVVLCDDVAIYQKSFNRLLAQIEGVFYARNLTSEPPNKLTPKAYAEKLKELEAFGIKVEIFDTSRLEELNMHCLLAVGRGSKQPPYMAVLTWNPYPEKNRQPVALIGKGVCFDAGGLCLKSAPHQFLMKWDKAGAGAVAGALKALSLSKADTYVIGVLGLVENMPGGNALKTSDVLETASGITVEIENTDAEGRLVLADCLYFAKKRFNPKVLVDLGTLTPETFASLGSYYAGLYSNRDELVKEFTQAGIASSDLVWELPMGTSYAKQIESSVADIKNLGMEHWGENGAAAEFLRRFIEDTPWVHLDISGVSWVSSDQPLAVKGVTGFGVRLLEEWIVKNQCFVNIN